MKLVIFIGHFKTGSTSLQRFLANNYFSLLNRGILYPSVESMGMAHNISTALRGRDQSCNGLSLNVTEPHNALAVRLLNEENNHHVPPYYPNLPGGFRMFDALDSQIHTLAPDTMILCAEVFALFGGTKTQKSLKRMARRFAEHDVTLYCSIRRPDEYLSSWHRQRLKFGGKLEPLRGKAFGAYRKTVHFQHDLMVNGWLEHFPDARLVLRDYRDVLRGGGSVGDFFYHAVGRDVSDLPAVKPENPSVPCAYAEIGRRALRELELPVARPFIAWLVRHADSVDHAADRDVEVFGADTRKALYEGYAPIHDALGALSGKPPFFSDFEDIGRVRPVSDLEAASEVLPKLRRLAARRFLDRKVQAWLKDLSI